MPYSLYAQCLLKHTLKTHGWEVQNQLLEKLFLAHFTEERGYDIDSLVFTVQNMDGPIDAAEVRALLESGELEEEVKEEAAMHSDNMPGVPSFFFNGSKGCSGAQEASALMQMLQEA
jgi:predicted DsbA family dithiol-disulfide isomerase